jgi:FkbM family methyltransferase
VARDSDTTALRTYADFERRVIHRPKVPPRFEQALVRNFFDFSPKGFFVDVGANDPAVDSQSFHLEQLGWRGLLIEPLPTYCELLRRNRSSQVVECACSSPENHGKSMPIKVAGVHSSLEPNLIAVGAKAETIAQVQVRTLDSVLRDYAVAPGFDLLSIDVEGHEMEVFKGVDLRFWRPRLVLLEDHVTGHQKHHHMRSQGYQLLLRTGLNSWYVPQDLQYTFSASARLEFFRKYWLGLLTRKIRYSK